MTRLAKDVMRHSVGVIDASATLDELESAFREADVSGFPVVDGDRVVGVITHSDVVRQLAGKGGEKPRPSSFYSDLVSFEVAARLSELATRAGHPVESLRVEDLMTPSVVSVAPDSSLRDLARTLVDHRIHRVLVTDEGTLVGVVSSLDLARLVAEGELVDA